MSSHPDKIISAGETEWGWWTPRPSPTQKGPDSPATPTTAGSGPSRQTGTSAPGVTHQNGTISADLSHRRACAAPPDTKYGLPTACLGEYFDRDLDDGLGHGPMSDKDMGYMAQLAPQLDRKMPSRRAVIEGWSWGSIWQAIKKHALKAYRATAKALTILASINKGISWRLPDPNKSEANKLRDEDAKQVNSPWGDAILLKSFGSEEPSDRDVTKFLNVYCVECGTWGSARLSGRVGWTPLGGFTEGRIEFHTDMVFSLKIGIDAEISYAREFTSDLLTVGLPGLSYGVVTIGPYASIGSRVALEAAAKGTMLAGAELGLQDAHVAIDLIHPSKSEAAGWEPYFKPVFEAEGQLMLSATLGLPFGLKCGLRIGSLEESVGIIDEPSIKGTAQVAASIGLTDNRTFSAGFEDIDGCTGICTELSWRNRLWVDILQIQEIPLFDTDDIKLARGCIPLPPQDNLATLTPGSNRTLPSEPLDLTGTYPGEKSDYASFAAIPLRSTPYYSNDSFKYSRLVDPNKTTTIMSCSNGNVYAVDAQSAENPNCTELWAATDDSTVVVDGTRKFMHYYGNSMSRLGVSRLRLQADYEVPRTGVVVALALYENATNPRDSYYLGVDPGQQVFYLLVCDYTDGNGPRVFLARDPDEGIKMLESEDLKYSVTGGAVGECYDLVLIQETLEGQGQSYLKLGSTRPL